MRSVRFTFFLTLLLPASIYAGSAGTTVGQSIQIGMDARAAGLGEAFTVSGRNADALHWNTAALSSLKSHSAAFTHASYLESSSLSQASYAQKLGETNAFGFSVRHFSAGDIDQSDDTGATAGSFSPRDLMVMAAAAHRMGNGYSLGLGAKFIQLKIIDSASTFAFDAGLLSPLYLDARLQWGLALRNAGGSIKFDTESDSLPMDYRGGAAFHLTKQWLVSADLVFPSDNDAHVNAGTEYTIPLERFTLAGRAGYNGERASDINGFSGVTFGFGVGMRQWTIDYALVPFGDLGLTHRVSVGVDF